MELTNLAFLETYTLPDDSGIMGAILVTDADTKPIEFRVTAPIKPTNFQKTLYGDVLREHILVELVAIPLLDAVNEHVDLILAKDPLFLGANNKQGVRVVRVFNEEDDPSENENAEKIAAPFDSNTEVRIETTKKFQAELPDIISKLSPISESRLLTEPFERLKTACEQVNLQKTSE